MAFNRRKGWKIYEHPAKDSIGIELLNLDNIKVFMNCKQQTPTYTITKRKMYDIYILGYEIIIRYVNI